MQLQVAQPLMSNDSRPQEIGVQVETIQVLEKEEATREKLLRSTLGEQRIKYEVFIRTTIHPLSTLS
jgi:hypothetical protein